MHGLAIHVQGFTRKVLGVNRSMLMLQVAVHFTGYAEPGTQVVLLSLYQLPPKLQACTIACGMTLVLKLHLVRGEKCG